MKLAALLLIAGCASHHDTTDTGGDAPAAGPAACAFLEGKTFTSTEDHECGLGPTGPTACRWHVAFTGDGSAMSAYTWGHSDVEEAGTVSCVGMTITVKPESSASLAATFDATTQTLHWDTFDYTP